MRIAELAKPYVIADIGSNWKRRDPRAHAIEQIKQAALCGVSAVKFQLFTHRELYGFDGPDNYALDKSLLPELASQCTENGVDFLCSAFSPQGLRYVDSFVNMHKLASSEMKHVQMLDVLIDLKKPFIISTGGAHFEELTWLKQYLTGCDYAFLECVASYPSAPSDYNLLFASDSVGLSDHTKTNSTALAAVGRGAVIFEKHFDAWGHFGLNDTPDSDVSIGPLEMKLYVQSIREAYSAMGDGIKRTRGNERDMTLRHRRRIKAIDYIKAGDSLLLDKNFGVYRSISDDERAAGPERLYEMAGRTVKRDFRPGEGIWIEDVI